MARTLVVLAVLVFTGLFALLNWTQFTTPTSLNFAFFEVSAPLGMIMLGLVVLLAIVFVVWALSMQATLIVESRRQSKELQAQRELADRAEASRFTELRDFVGQELARTHYATMTRIGVLEAEQRRLLGASERREPPVLGR
jgi:uncharacterized integral membrane protein